mmetsp:Transcript_13785/g.45988  ORF Transcript_13785/g.45988 Transcript_13785/m.45988 type:complete len:249 (-) Transcript_13785:74-820(-)
MLRTLLPALTIALLAAFVHRCCLRMADPFGDVAGLPIDEARAALFTGAPNGSAFPAALVGVFESNRRLRGATLLFTEEVHGSECVGVAPNGDLLMLDRHGFVFRATPQQRKGGALAYELSKERHYVGPGRPLGFHVAGEWLYVCCSLKGLLRLHLGSGAIELLSGATGSPPSPLAYANDLDLDTSGAVYFSSSSDHPVALHPLAGFYDTMRGYLLTSLHGGTTGRLLRYDPASRRTAVLLEGICRDTA